MIHRLVIAKAIGNAQTRRKRDSFFPLFFTLSFLFCRHWSPRLFFPPLLSPSLSPPICRTWPTNSRCTTSADPSIVERSRRDEDPGLSRPRGAPKKKRTKTKKKTRSERRPRFFPPSRSLSVCESVMTSFFGLSFFSPRESHFFPSFFSSHTHTHTHTHKERESGETQRRRTRE